MVRETEKRSVEKLATQYLEAWLRRDVEEILTFHTPDSVFTSVATGKEAIGQEAVREALKTVFAVWPDIRFRVRRLYTSPDLIVCESTAEATQALPLAIGNAVILPTGHPATFEVADIFPLQDGLIKRKDSYWDALDYQRQMSARMSVASL